MRRYRPIFLMLAVILALSGLTGCNYPGMQQPTPRVRYITWTPGPATDTPVPTDTPAPTATFTAQPSPTFTVAAPPTQAAEAAPTQPAGAATIAPDKTIRIYYINEDEAGQFGCNEALWYVTLKSQGKTGDIPKDVQAALAPMLSLHQPYMGKLRHGGYASNLAVSKVEMREDGGVIVSLTGEYIAGDNRCDGKRFIDQMRQTIRAAGAPGYIQILVNGTPVADVVARNK